MHGAEEKRSTHILHPVVACEIVARSMDTLKVVHLVAANEIVARSMDDLIAVAKENMKVVISIPKTRTIILTSRRTQPCGSGLEEKAY